VVRQWPCGAASTTRSLLMAGPQQVVRDDC
jgi:hypothetical protein